MAQQLITLYPYNGLPEDAKDTERYNAMKMALESIQDKLEKFVTITWSDSPNLRPTIRLTLKDPNLNRSGLKFNMGAGAIQLQSFLGTNDDFTIVGRTSISQVKLNFWCGEKVFMVAIDDAWFCSFMPAHTYTGEPTTVFGVDKGTGYKSFIINNIKTCNDISGSKVNRWAGNGSSGICLSKMPAGNSAILCDEAYIIDGAFDEVPQIFEIGEDTYYRMWANVAMKLC